ncbi:MAG: bifunctional adenosylcobinamide kinase/adenosylcobinamide-phosphate guanylyltransferase [Chloroflexi bacterium]|nr:bifunctional adenosylcobinamide kinase/adenosylcobinamide-phosphate guanylyltransferase [Chloroflexota bacterium]
MAKRLTLVLGGVRAGKSSYAQKLAMEGGRVLFVATAEAGDQEMAERIQAHKNNRPADWDTLEEPLNLAAALGPLLNDYDTVLIDCLTLWVSNLLLRDEDATGLKDIPTLAQELLALYKRGQASWIVVSNEVGLGVVPPTEMGRAYADELGRVNQMVAAEADAVYYMVAGLSLNLKALDTGGHVT